MPKQALQKLGVWNVAEPRMAPTADVRAALLLVERGEAPAGIVYATDAAVSKGVMVAGVFPESSHDPITYPFAVVKARRHTGGAGAADVHGRSRGAGDLHRRAASRWNSAIALLSPTNGRPSS